MMSELKHGSLAGQDLSLLTAASVLRHVGGAVLTFVEGMRNGQALLNNGDVNVTSGWDSLTYIGERTPDGMITAPAGGWVSNPVPGRVIAEVVYERRAILGRRNIRSEDVSWLSVVSFSLIEDAKPEGEGGASEWAVAAERAAADAYSMYMGAPDGRDDLYAARQAAADAIEKHALAALSTSPQVPAVAGEERLSREYLARQVREAWVRWAQTQPEPKASWLVPYDGLSEPDKEADRQIGEHIRNVILSVVEERAALEAFKTLLPLSPTPSADQSGVIGALRKALTDVAGHVTTMERECTGSEMGGLEAVARDCIPVFERVGMSNDGDGWGFSDDAPVSNGVIGALVEWFSGLHALELSYGYDEMIEGDEGCWRVHRQSGGINDREWTLIAQAKTVGKAFERAHQALAAHAASIGGKS